MQLLLHNELLEFEEVYGMEVFKMFLWHYCKNIFSASVPCVAAGVMVEPSD